MSEAERRVAADSWLARRVIARAEFAGLKTTVSTSLAALGQGYAIMPAKRRYRPRGAWKKLRRCKCR